MRIRTSRRSTFDTLIDDLFATVDTRGDEAPRSSHHFSIASLEAAWGLSSQLVPRPRTAEDPNRPWMREGYRPSEAARDISLDPDVIIAEIGLFAGASETDVAALRRQFALRNHPDRFPPEIREIATQRMMIANGLLDCYLAKARKTKS